MKKLQIIFGGNFDPIHYGHLYIAEKLLRIAYIKKISFLPNNNPPHRKKTETAIIDRINMIKTCIQKNVLFEINYLEVKKQKIFYTIDTLNKIRMQIGFLQPLCYLIGEDNLNNLNSWKNWRDILSLCHLIVIPRQCKKIKNFYLQQWIKDHLCSDLDVLYKKPYGLIFFIQIPYLNISSSQIRKYCHDKKNIHELVPLNVKKYILSKKLYLYE